MTVSKAWREKVGVGGVQVEHGSRLNQTLRGERGRESKRGA